MRSATLFFALGIIATLPGALFSQTVASLTEGERVRITAPRVFARPTVGTFVGRHGDTLVVRGVRAPNDPTAMDIPVEVIERLAIIRRRSPGEGAWRGAQLGIVGGGLIGLGLGLQKGKGGPPEDRADVGTYAAVGAGGLGLIGALIGALAPGERWNDVMLPVRIGLGTGAGAAITVSLRM